MLFELQQYIEQKLSIKEGLEQSPFPILLGHRGKFFYGNKQALDLLELNSVSQLIGSDVLQFTHQSSLKDTKNDLIELDTHNRIKDTIRNILTSNGRPLTIHSSIIPISIDSKRIDYVVIKQSEGTVNKRTCFELQNTHFEMLLEHSVDAIALVTNQHLHYINQAGVELLGATSSSDLIGQNILNFFPSTYHKELEERFQSVLNFKNLTEGYERDIIDLNGHSKIVRTIIMPFEIHHQPSFQIIIRDVTKEKLLKEKEIQSEKLLTAGRLAAGIAHELRNPLTAVKGFLQLLQEQSSSLNHYLDIMSVELNKIEQITGQLLSLSNPLAHKYKSLYLSDILHETVGTLRQNDLIHNISIQLEVPLNSSKIYGNVHQLSQMLHQLIKNSIESIRVKGTIVIRLVEYGDECHIQIQDTGCGINQDLQHKIFEPFFTTKDFGTGLGLTIVASIVEEHNGKLSFTSNKKGTTFRITFPKYKNEAVR
ncbi:hypothetical protein Q73_04370 [Bacillus coahuilensis m2-6]|uniref:ATP-binding protein n=1 Tax=Bacillus coahuilensis TaxID=408580 RepID=UPI0007506B92|nr:ATP-binding protein [Bacillus coahuilensis]KUP08892.1 hypothetical protein Q73_04370 [Bacillus coahuilensis m2-6]